MTKLESEKPVDQPSPGTTFDFCDGRGPVPAHRHRNPDGSKGGWVANTATVDSTARIGLNACVSGHGCVSGRARVSGGAWVSDRACVIGNACITGGIWMWSPLQIRGSRDFVNMASPTELAIGCLIMPLAEWLADIRGEHAIGKQYGYSDAEMAEYDLYVELAAKIYPQEKEVPA